MSKDKDVYINIKSIQSDADEFNDTTELFTVGKFSKAKSKNAYKIFYEESEATGFHGNSVTLDVEDNSMVTMTRKGSAMSTLIIERGKKHHCHYGTPFGDFLIGITTDDIKSELSDNGGNLYLKYTIDINSSFMSQNEMFINVKEYVHE